MSDDASHKNRKLVKRLIDLEREVRLLRAENADLRKPQKYQTGHESGGTSGDSALTTDASAPSSMATTNLTPEQKIVLFKGLFKGRTDVYPLRWEKQNGKSGYAPACGNEWRPGVCEKPRIKCADCPHRLFLPLTDEVLYDHLAGEHTIGVYPLMRDDTCHFLAIDLDEAEWREDARALMQSCRELKIAAALEISRSGKGAHIWIFFATAIPASIARRLGSALISYTCAQLRQLNLSSYDRLFPNQDSMPKGGFGNLIALPLQKMPRERGFSVFVDEKLVPHIDQWGFLSGIKQLALEEVEGVIQRATGGSHPLDVAFLSEEEEEKPWLRRKAAVGPIPGPLPAQLTATLADRIYFEKAALPQPLANRLIRLASFQNPRFYQAQAMRFSVWNIPRVICCAESFPKHIALPRGCLDAVRLLCKDHGIVLDLQDERTSGQKIAVSFVGTLREDQKAALSAMIKHDIGVLSAPTAFGKTVTGAAVVAKRRVNTLILVHRVELLKQWKERLAAFLQLPDEYIGTIGGGKQKRTGKIDIAVMQSLVRKGQVAPVVGEYAQIIVDECHHLSAVSFEAILKQAKARYILGLTATPFRRDGQHPIIFMQCGPVRHEAAVPPNAPTLLEVWPQHLVSEELISYDVGIQDIFRRLTENPGRNARLANDIASLYKQGRKVIVMTERTAHVEALYRALLGQANNLFVLHGRLAKRQRNDVLKQLELLPDDAPRIVVTTGKLLGEGFDHAPLDTLVLAMPISWKGTLQQYAGRLHREHVLKDDVRVYDYVDHGSIPLERMWVRRQRGYRNMGYVIKP